MNFKLNADRAYVIEWERALEFYSKTLGMAVAFAGPDLGWAELDTGGAHLALERSGGLVARTARAKRHMGMSGTRKETA